MKTTAQKWLSLLCVTAMLLTSLSAMLVTPVAAWSTYVDNTMDFSLLPNTASDFECVDAGMTGSEGKVTVTKNSNGGFTFKSDKGWPYAFSKASILTESNAAWANINLTQDVYLNFDFRVTSGTSKVVVYYCGQNPKDMAAVGNYIDLNAMIKNNYDPGKGGTDDDLGVGMYQGSINMKDLHVDVDYKKDPYVNPDLVVDGMIDVSGFKVFAVGAAEVIVNDISIGKQKYGAPGAVVKELNLLTNGSSNGWDDQSDVTFADGAYTVKVNKAWDSATDIAYGMQVNTKLHDFDLGATTNLHFAIESDVPWRLTTLDSELGDRGAWFGMGAMFGSLYNTSGLYQSPDEKGFYPAGKYELCVDYGNIYVWYSDNGLPTYDVTSACLDGIFIEAKDPGTMKISTLKLSGSDTFSHTPGTFTGGGIGNDVVEIPDTTTDVATATTTTRKQCDVVFTVETVRPVKAVSAGTVFDVNVTISDVKELNGIELKLGYDDTQLRLVDAVFQNPVAKFDQCNIVTDPLQPLTDGGEVWATAFDTTFSYNTTGHTVLTLTFEALTDIDDRADVTVLACDATTVPSIYGGYLLNVEWVDGGIVVTPLAGDLDRNGVCDAEDAVSAFYWLSGLTILSEEQQNSADMNDDGKVTLYDVATIFYVANELI